MNMKKLEYILLGLLVGFAMGACSSDDENAGVVDPVFPESQSYEIIPDQVCEISFEASTEWRVTTDKQWLKFIDETGKFQSLTGKAGKQTVRVTATNGALGFTDDKAQVKLTMGGKTQTIAEMNRAAKERVAKMYTVKGSDIIEINEFVDKTFNRTEQIGFEANFDWKIDMASLPGWILSEGAESSLIENLCGEAGQTISHNRMGSINIKLEERYKDLSGYITIRDIESDYTCQFPVSAPGIEAGQIMWIGQVVNLRRGITWNDKGKKLILDPGSGDVISVTDELAACHVVIRDNDFEYRFMEWDPIERTAKEVPAEDIWVEVEKEGGVLTLKAKENTNIDVRKMVLFLVPKNTEVDYDSHFTKYNGTFNFNTKGYGIELNQYGAITFKVWKQINSMKYEYMAEATKAANAEAIAENLGLENADNIFEYSFTKEQWDMSERLHITPLGMISWHGKFELFDENYKSLGTSAIKWAASCGNGNVYDEAYKAYPSIKFENRIPFADITDDCLYIVIRDNNDKDLGTFVIRKNNEATIK